MIYFQLPLFFHIINVFIFTLFIISLAFLLYAMLVIKQLVLFYTVKPYLDLLIFAILLFTIPFKYLFCLLNCLLKNILSDCFREGLCFLLLFTVVFVICNESLMKCIYGRQSLDGLQCSLLPGISSPV